MRSKKQKQPEPRILARRLARPLNEEEMQIVNGGAVARLGVLAGGTTVRLADTWSCTGCPANDCDS